MAVAGRLESSQDLWLALCVCRCVGAPSSVLHPCYGAGKAIVIDSGCEVDVTMNDGVMTCRASGIVSEALLTQSQMFMKDNTHYTSVVKQGMRFSI